MIEVEHLQGAFERALAKVAGRSFCNPNPRTSEELTAILDAKIAKQQQKEKEQWLK